MSDYEVKNRRAFEFTRRASNAAVGIVRIIMWPYRWLRDVLVAAKRVGKDHEEGR